MIDWSVGNGDGIAANRIGGVAIPRGWGGDGGGAVPTDGRGRAPNPRHGGVGFVARAPLRPCGIPGCPVLTDGPRCPAHQRQHEQARGSRIERGYDKDWLRLRSWFMGQPENQLCRHCLAKGIVTLAVDCDHVIPFRDRDDPRRLDPKNLQPLCRDCHAIKTNGGGVEKSLAP